MKRLQLDYSPQRAHLRNIVGIATLAACLLAGFWLLTEQRNLNEQLSRYQAQVGQRSGLQGGRAPAMSAEDRQAGEVTYALNMPWNAMLTALEQVQAVSSGVHLLTVQPNPIKGEVQLSGEAEDFAQLMTFMQALRAKSSFSEVILVNQRLAGDGGRPRLTFTLLAQWKP